MIQVRSLAKWTLHGATIFALLLTISACAQEADDFKQKYPIDQLNQRNKRFSLYHDSPTAKILNQKQNLQNDINPMIFLLKKIVRGIDEERKQKRNNACNLQEKYPNWVYTSRINSRFFQIGDLSTTCYTQMDGEYLKETRTLSTEEVSDSVNTIGRGVDALFKALDGVTDWSLSLGNSEWNKTYPLRGWRNQDLSEECTVETFSAYRKRADVYIRAAMTNYDVDEYIRTGSRQFVMEWVKDDYSTSLRMVQPKLGRCKMDNGSTILWTRSARAWLSWHGEMRESTNPALQKVIEANEVDIDLAEDAVAAANIALLALPLVMTLIPVAFLAEVNSFGFFLYTVFTDIISTVPLLIKGIELVRATHSRSELVSYYAGNEELADIQVWAASCRGTREYRYLGISFIVVSTLAIIVGVVIELLATKYMENKKEDENNAVVEGPFGKVLLDISAGGLLGTGHRTNWERYSETMDVRDDEEERENMTENMKSPWRSWWQKIRSDASRTDEPEMQSDHVSYPSKTFEEKHGSEDFNTIVVAGVGKDGLTSAERVEAVFSKYEDAFSES